MSDGIWAKVTGRVGRVFDTKNGRGMVVEVTRPNAQYPDRVTVWDSFTYQTGDRVSVEGWLSWRKTEKDGKTYVDVSLNSPRVVGEAPAERSPQAEESWSSTGGYDDAQTPF